MSLHFILGFLAGILSTGVAVMLIVGVGLLIIATNDKD